MHQTISNSIESKRHVAADGSLPPMDEHQALRSLVGPLLTKLRAADLNKLHRALTMDLVEASFNARPVALRFVFVLNYSQFGRLGLSESQVADVLNGRRSEKGWIEGLCELKIVSKKEMTGGGVVLAVNPDWSQWDCKWIYSAAEKSSWLADISAQTGDVLRQMESDEIKERFSLATLLPAVDVENALLLAVGERRAKLGDHRMRDVVARGDAPMVAKAGTAGVVRAPRVGNVAGDAPLVRPKRIERSCAAPHSEIANANCEEKGGAFGNREPSRARCNWNLEIGIENLQLQVASAATSDELEKIKVALNDGDERRFIAAARLVISAGDWDDGRPAPQRFKGDGGKWRNRFNHAPSRSLAIAVLLDCVEQDNYSGKAAEDLWLRWGGAALDAARFEADPKKVRRLLNTQ